MNQDGVPQCTRPQLNKIKQSSGIITSIIDPRWTMFLKWWRWEQFHNFNLIGLLSALKTLNLVWKSFTVFVELRFTLFESGTFEWLDKSYESLTFLVKWLHHES